MGGPALLAGQLCAEALSQGPLLVGSSRSGSGLVLVQLNGLAQSIEHTLNSACLEGVVGIGHRKFGAGRQPAGTFHIKLGIKLEEQGFPLLQGQCVDRDSLEPLIRQGEPLHIAGQLAGVQTDGLHIPGQFKDGGHGVVGGRIGRHRRREGILLGKSQAAVIVQGQAEQGHVVVGLVLFHLSELLFQGQAPLCQFGDALVRKGKLFFQFSDLLLRSLFGCTLR